MTHRIKFPIGDWSDDGHGKVDWFIVKSNKSLEDLIGAHLLFKEKVGFDIGEICAEYEENIITGIIAQFVKDLNVLGDGDEYEVLNEKGEYVDEHNTGLLSLLPINGQISILDTKTVLKIWLACLRYADPELELEVEADDLPSMINWSVAGTKYKGQYLDTPGYGMFH